MAGMLALKKATRRASSSAGIRCTNAVLLIPSGSKMCLEKYASIGRPESTSTQRPMTSMPIE